MSLPVCLCSCLIASSESPYPAWEIIWREVPSILMLCCFPKIPNAIIRSITIDVVDFWLRPFAVYEQPSKAARSIPFAIDHDGPISPKIDISCNRIHLRVICNSYAPSKLPRIRIIRQQFFESVELFHFASSICDQTQSGPFPFSISAKSAHDILTPFPSRRSYSVR